MLEMMTACVESKAKVDSVAFVQEYLYYTATTTDTVAFVQEYLYYDPGNVASVAFVQEYLYTQG
ncbi:hypothetical protein [Enterobacter hormaechei]